MRAVWFNRISALVWLGLSIPAFLFWRDSVMFVIAASIYANVKSDVGAAEAADDRTVLDKLAEIEERLSVVQSALTATKKVSMAPRRIGSEK